MPNAGTSVELNSAGRASRILDNFKSIGKSKTTTDITYAAVGIITVLGFFYMVMASVGINLFSKCESMKGKPVQENLNKFLAVTLTIALTIPMTLLISKFSSKDGAAFAIVYSLMGIIGSAATLNWTLKCENAKDNEKGLASFAIALFVLSLLMGMYFMMY
jgi:uncharacterized membrane protein YuzA (DUF378 family)